MNVQTNERHRLRKLVVALASAAAIAAPAAAAGAGTGAPIKDENYRPSALLVEKGAPIKDENYRPSALLVESATPSIVVATSPGFQWDDAALGAGSTLGILALGLGGILVLRRNRTEPQLS
jgi:hypothetical protein